MAAFAGGALTGRELESGTAHLAWTQGISPTHWLAAKLLVPAGAVTVGSTALILTYRWTRDATDPLLYNDGWSDPAVFLATGPAPVAYALCALATGTLAALLTSRTLPALALATAGTVVLHAVLHTLRPSLRAPLTTTGETPAAAWVLTSPGAPTATYHPKSHFWPLHLMETGIVLAVTALAVALCFRVLRRSTP